MNDVRREARRVRDSSPSELFEWYSKKVTGELLDELERLESRILGIDSSVNQLCNAKGISRVCETAEEGLAHLVKKLIP